MTEPDVYKRQVQGAHFLALRAGGDDDLLVFGPVSYTHLRARELLVIVGDDAAIRSMAANDRQQKRYSGLKWRLCHAGDASE